MSPQVLVNAIADAIITMEGGSSPKSVNAHLYRQYGVWNVGHFRWVDGLDGPTGVLYGAHPYKLSNGVWAGWVSRDASVEAVRKQVRLYINRGLSLAELIGKYAPPTENNTQNYITYVATRVGIDPQLPLKEILQDADGEFNSNPPKG